ncbi:RHS repeat-associated core domain-containing protein, partial [Luteimonas sp. RD2P54]
MSQAKQGGAVAMHYVYNGKGEQVRRHLGASDATTVFDEAGRWLGDYDAAGTPLQQAVWLYDFPVGLLVGPSGINRLHYVQPDHLGTPRAVIDPLRNVAVWNWDLASEAFGNSPPNEDPDGDGIGFWFDMRFPGQRYDAASGLNYNYFRDYEPGAGRYSQSDPIGIAGGVALYGYAFASPSIYFDRFGLAPGNDCWTEWEVSGEYLGEIVARKVGLPRLFRRTCLPIPQIGQFGPMDAIPSIGRHRGRGGGMNFRVPLPVPLSLLVACKNEWIQNISLKQANIRDIIYYEVCIDDCGIVSRTPFDAMKDVVWRDLGPSQDIWSEWDWYQ